MGQGIADGGQGNDVSDVIRKKERELPQQGRVCQAFFSLPFSSFQNVPQRDRGINTVQNGQRLFLVQANIGDSRHPTQTQEPLEQFPQLIAFPCLVKDLSPHTTKDPLCLPDFKAMEVQKFPKGERQHFDLDTSAGEIGRIL